MREQWRRGMRERRRVYWQTAWKELQRLRLVWGSVVETSVLIVLFLPGAQQRRRVRGAPVSHRATTSKGRRGTIWSALP